MSKSRLRRLNWHAGQRDTHFAGASGNPDQIDRVTASVLDLAKATGTDATLASGIMAASIRQFSLDAGDAGRVADALTVAANKSFNTLESLGEAQTYAGPVASDFNMSIEDTLALLGALGNVGIQGSNAGTALRQLLTLSGAEAEKLKEIFTALRFPTQAAASPPATSHPLARGPGLTRLRCSTPPSYIRFKTRRSNRLTPTAKVSLGGIYERPERGAR